MREYQGYAISNFRTGFDEAVEPWLLPRDAYQSLINAHLYRGVLQKISGYTLFAIMTRRTIVSLGIPDGSTKTFTGMLTNVPSSTNMTGYGTIIVGTSAEIFNYSGDHSPNTINLTGSAGGTATINIFSGQYSFTFNTAPPSGSKSAIFLIYDTGISPLTAIMGIKQYYGSNGAQDVLVFDQKSVGKIVNTFGIIAAEIGVLNVVQQIPFDYYVSALFTGNGSTTTFSGTLDGAPFVPGTLIWTEYTSAGVPTGRVITDNGVGGLIGTGVASGSVNYFTGSDTITFSVAPPSGNYFDSTTSIFGALFTGSISNFFSLTNYQYKAFFCNNVDPIFYYDGTSIHYLNTNLSQKVVSSSAGVPEYDITKCLHLFTDRERLLLISPTVENVMIVYGVYWSTAGNPLNFTNDEQLFASTSESIKAIGFINTDLVIRFSNSERIFKYTSDAFSPFRFDSTNNIWACDAPYSSINYDKWFSTVGRPAIVGSDAVNVKRVDEIIPDFTDQSRIADQTPVPFMNQTSIMQCYGERFDDFKEGWLCYNSQPVDQSETTASDNILAFNYLDETYAIYDFPFSCLGFGRIINVPTWATTFTNWNAMYSTWDSFQITNNALIDLAGDQFDNVYQLNTGNTYGDGVTPILMSVITKNFNPFVEQGELCRFGYLDLLVSANQESILRVQFFLNDQLYIDSNGNPAGYYQETILTFTPTDAMSPMTDQIKIWKRIYIGSVAKEHTIRFYQNSADFTSQTLDQPINIHAMILWMKPGGRIFN